VVLAAGGAARFGGGKLLAPLHGRPLIEYALGVAGRARAAGLIGRVVAVVAPDSEAIGRLARQTGAEVVVNPAPGQGLALSLIHILTLPTKRIV
jgi:molybdenum cofactor cytidylyltransferase